MEGLGLIEDMGPGDIGDPGGADWALEASG
jgi:hypothetical protein